ncbi:hypothetical protein F4808DRAFT_464621 [Astrocystis sublimbata]|nr:hypothetical protein F4808DRAFT_464621 [Astrocystis sublimbata]
MAANIRAAQASQLKPALLVPRMSAMAQAQAWYAQLRRANGRRADCYDKLQAEYFAKSNKFRTETLPVDESLRCNPTFYDTVTGRREVSEPPRRLDPVDSFHRINLSHSVANTIKYAIYKFRQSLYEDQQKDYFNKAEEVRRPRQRRKRLLRYTYDQPIGVARLGRHFVWEGARNGDGTYV